jgi:carbonic anhydrase
LLKTALANDWEALVRQAVRDNVAASVRHLRCCEALEHLIDEDGLLVVGAEYSLETGIVEFFNNIDDG